MKVYELMEMLEGADPEKDVVIGYDYGSRGGSNCIARIRTVHLATLKESSYSDSGKAVKTVLDFENCDEDGEVVTDETVVVLNSISQRGYC